MKQFIIALMFAIAVFVAIPVQAYDCETWTVIDDGVKICTKCCDETTGYCTVWCT